MMFVLVCVLVALILGGLVGLLVTRDPGYVMISYAEYVVETSLWVGILLVIGLLLFFWLSGWLIRRVLQSQRGLNSFFLSRKVRAARSATVRGLLIMAEGRWQEARKLLVSAAGAAETPLINYLNAARASHELGEHQVRDEYLLAAQESTPGARFAVGLTQAEFNMEEGQYETALAILLELRKRAPKHRAVLGMLAETREALNDWQALERMLGDLKKHQVMDTAALEALSTRIWHAKIMDPAHVEQSVKALPKTLQTDAVLIQEWVDQLLEQGRPDAGRLSEEVLRMSINKEYNAELVLRYGEVDGGESAKQIGHVNGWLKHRADDPDLLLTLGRLEMRTDQLAQARQHFEASLAQRANDTVYAELGRLCIAMDDQETGVQYLLQALSGLPQVPALQNA
ncbi:MAG: heme biosynthesis HemY N-terminal domain-containing protein [Pseudomonadota bacterium]